MSRDSSMLLRRHYVFQNWCGTGRRRYANEGEPDAHAFDERWFGLRQGSRNRGATVPLLPPPIFLGGGANAAVLPPNNSYNNSHFSVIPLTGTDLSPLVAIVDLQQTHMMGSDLNRG